MKTVTIPIDPPDSLLKSMALRYNHAYGLSIGIDDSYITELRERSPLMGNQYLTSSERESILTTMRQLHEEVIGTGFYKYE